MYIPGFFPMASALLNRTLHSGLQTPVVEKVAGNLWDSANKSWELGVMAEALTEYNWASYSVFSDAAFPPPGTLDNSSTLEDVLDIVNNVLAAKEPNTLTLFADESAGDPASLGVAVLLANWTRGDKSDNSYSTAAADQLSYLLDYAPKTDDGAISHRTDQVQLWADSVYMVPPFLAYYGALQGGEEGEELLQMAYDQIRLYRDALVDDGLWRHVIYGDWEDDTHWATGNGWAAAGMLRVLQTLNRTEQAGKFASQQADLASWIRETLDAIWEYQTDNGTLLNVVDDSTSFADSAATALLASVTYRMAAFDGDTSLNRAANRALSLVESSMDDDGWLQNVVDPYTFSSRLPDGEHSPEAQAFVLLLHSAWRDYAAQLKELNARRSW
ncbi:Six-hairpin glycosidase-like protein [Schizophyllum commune]